MERGSWVIPTKIGRSKVQFSWTPSSVPTRETANVMFGMLGLFIAWRALHLLTTIPALILALVAGLGWLALSLFFMEYWEPSFNIAVFVC